MKKALGALKTILYITIVYCLTFSFIAVFTISAEAISNVKKSEDVTVTPDKIEISGNKRLKNKEILLLSGLDRKKSWFQIDKEKVESYLIASGWIRNVQVTKHFPDSVTIKVQEYEPSIIVNSIRKAKGEKDLYTMWFADSDGIVFKRAFPGETDISLPFFHIDYEMLDSKKRELKIKTAVTVSNLWKKSTICKVSSISYDLTKGFSADCEGDNSMTTVINFGQIKSIKELENMKDRFFRVSEKLKKDNKWAGEYIFEKRGEKIRIIVGKVFQNINRGKNA